MDKAQGRETRSVYGRFRPRLQQHQSAGPAVFGGGGSRDVERPATGGRQRHSSDSSLPAARPTNVGARPAFHILPHLNPGRPGPGLD